MFSLAEAVDVCESHAQCRAFVVTNQTTWTGEPEGGASQKSGYTSPKDVKGPLRKGRGQASMMREKYTHVLQGSHFIESNLTSKKKITQICKLLSLPLGRKLVFFKTGWNQVVPDASKTTYVKAPG